ncbi:hypothetical protein KAR48_17220 [bacterium]|nr:hypothetical protein [bacterium]
MKSNYRLSIAIMLFAVIGMSQAQTAKWEAKVKVDSENHAVLLEAGIACHNLAVRNNSKAVKLSEKYLEKVLQIDRRNAVAMVYYGSLMTIFARDAEQAWEKMEYMQTALAKMDKAVMLSPDDAEIRLVRATNAIHLPDMFNRGDMAIKDFQHIEKLIGLGKVKFSGEDWVLYWFSYGQALNKKGERQQADSFYKKVLEVAPDSPLGKSASQILSNRE